MGKKSGLRTTTHHISTLSFIIQEMIQLLTGCEKTLSVIFTFRSMQQLQNCLIWDYRYSSNGSMCFQLATVWVSLIYYMHCTSKILTKSHKQTLGQNQTLVPLQLVQVSFSFNNFHLNKPHTRTSATSINSSVNFYGTYQERRRSITLSPADDKFVQITLDCDNEVLHSLVCPSIQHPVCSMQRNIIVIICHCGFFHLKSIYSKQEIF